MDRIIKRTSLKPGCEMLFAGALLTVERVERTGRNMMTVDLAGFGPVNLNSDTMVAIRVPKRPRSPRAVPPPMGIPLSAEDREWVAMMTGSGRAISPADLLIYALHHYREEIEHEQAPRRRRWPWRRLRAA